MSGRKAMRPASGPSSAVLVEVALGFVHLGPECGRTSAPACTRVSSTWSSSGATSSNWRAARCSGRLAARAPGRRAQPASAARLVPVSASKVLSNMPVSVGEAVGAAERGGPDARRRLSRSPWSAGRGRRRVSRSMIICSARWAPGSGLGRHIGGDHVAAAWASSARAAGARHRRWRRARRPQSGRWLPSAGGWRAAARRLRRGHRGASRRTPRCRAAAGRQSAAPRRTPDRRVTSKVETMRCVGSAVEASMMPARRRAIEARGRWRRDRRRLSPALSATHDRRHAGVEASRRHCTAPRGTSSTRPRHRRGPAAESGLPSVGRCRVLPSGKTFLSWARVMRGQARTVPVSTWTKGLPEVG